MTLLARVAHGQAGAGAAPASPTGTPTPRRRRPRSPSLPVGYGDGLPRHASGTARAARRAAPHGRRAGLHGPGRRSTSDPTRDAAIGDVAVVFGDGRDGEPTATDWADAAGHHRLRDRDAYRGAGAARLYVGSAAERPRSAARGRRSRERGEQRSAGQPGVARRRAGRRRRRRRPGAGGRAGDRREAAAAAGGRPGATGGRRGLRHAPLGAGRGSRRTTARCCTSRSTSSSRPSRPRPPPARPPGAAAHRRLQPRLRALPRLLALPAQGPARPVPAGVLGPARPRPLGHRPATAPRRSTRSGRTCRRVLTAVAPEGPVVLVGHSMGGMTIMSLAEQDPEFFDEPRARRRVDLHQRRRPRPARLRAARGSGRSSTGSRRRR